METRTSGKSPQLLNAPIAKTPYRQPLGILVTKRTMNPNARPMIVYRTAVKTSIPTSFISSRSMPEITLLNIKAGRKTLRIACEIALVPAESRNFLRARKVPQAAVRTNLRIALTEVKMIEPKLTVISL